MMTPARINRIRELSHGASVAFCKDWLDELLDHADAQAKRIAELEAAQASERAEPAPDAWKPRKGERVWFDPDPDRWRGRRPPAGMWAQVDALPNTCGGVYLITAENTGRYWAYPSEIKLVKVASVEERLAYVEMRTQQHRERFTAIAPELSHLGVLEKRITALEKHLVKKEGQ